VGKSAHGVPVVGRRRGTARTSWHAAHGNGYREVASDGGVFALNGTGLAGASINPGGVGLTASQ